MTEIIDACWKRKGVQGDRSCELLDTRIHCHNCEIYGAHAERIMQRSLPKDYRREWAEHFAHEEQEHHANDYAALVFRIGREWLALPAHVMAMVAEHQPAHRLPHRGSNVLAGIVNIRGRLYPCMSLARLLDINDTQKPAYPSQRTYPRLLAVQLQQQAFALPADALYGIHRYIQTDLQEPPPANKTLYRYILGILHVEQMVVGCLDPELLGHKLASVLK